ncbi:MAG: ABC transporter substrate-binding protein [Gammaproteobacteria bacterium]|nr:ABC transporter substrate-binding protein [Gammaproteobacteria bacterium]
MTALLRSLLLMIMLGSLSIAAAEEAATDAATEVSSATPHAVIESRATALAEQLKGRQDYYNENTTELYDVVRNLLLPGFDVQYASKLVLGRTHWTAATEAQRERFIQAFYSFLVRTYAKGLLGFDQSNMTVDPEASYSKDGDKALVKTTLALENGDAVNINYALRETADGWKMYDVRIDGVSYIQNYRSQFDAEISDLGIDAVISRLESESGGAADSA